MATSRENTNFARICRMLVDVAASALRNVFDSIHNSASLQSVLCGNFTKLHKLKNKGILNDSQWNLLFPTPPVCVSSSKFDVTLLVVLLRNICSLPAPTKGWDTLPLSRDTNVQDDIARIKYYRNKAFAHAPKASMTDVDFTDVWKEVEDALLRLGAKAEHLNNLKCSFLDPEAERCIRALTQWCLQEQNVKEIQKLNRGMKRTHEKVQAVAQEVRKVRSRLDKVWEDQQVKAETHGATASQVEAGNKDSPTSSDFVEEHLHPQVKSLLHKLREEYKKREAFVHPVPWCEDFQLSLETIYTEVRIVSRKKERSQLTRRLWGLYEIFKPHDECGNPRVVFLEGKPGMGKTVSCQKVTYDWSMGKISGFLADFEILLKIKCRDVKSSGIKEAIAEQLLPQDVLQEVKIAFFNHIQKSQSQVLLVLDGLDELKEGIDLSPLIMGRVLPDCHLVLTSRGNPDLRQHCDTLFQIIGFTPEHASSFIRQYFRDNEAKAKVLLDKIPAPRRTGTEAVGASRGVGKGGETCEDNDEMEDDENGERIQDGENKEDWPEADDGGVLRELISNPLNTALLCAVVDDTNGRLPSTATVLYQEMAFCVLARYYKRNGQDPPNDPMATHKEDLDALGRLAQKGIENDRLHFDEDDFRAEGCKRSILDFGFLSKEASASRIRPRSSYQFLHRTFQEFFSAIYLCQQLLSGNCDCLSYLGQGKYKQVTLFIVGLLSQKPEGKQICLRLMSSITKSLSNSDRRDSFLYICDAVRECVEAQLKQAMCTTVVENFTWQKLALWDCDLNECKEEMKIVCAALRENRPLELLNLMNNKIRDVTSLAQSVERNETLRLLYLSDNPFTDVSPLTQSLKNNTKLSELQLDEKFHGESIVEELEKQNEHLDIYYWM